VDELDTLKPEYMEKLGDDNSKKLRGVMQEHFKAYSPFWFLCSCLSGSKFLETEYVVVCADEAMYTGATSMAVCNEMLGLPFFIRRILVPFVFGPRYAGFWKYSPHPEVSGLSTCTPSFSSLRL
jgi:hypothetical protein